MFKHITIEEMNSLNEDEKILLLCICNIWAPIRPPMPSTEDPYPITLNIIRYTIREAVLDRIIQAEKVIKLEAKSIYENLCLKLKIPRPEVVKETVKEVEKTEVSGSITPPLPDDNNMVTGSVDLTNTNVSGSVSTGNIS